MDRCLCACRFFDSLSVSLCLRIRYSDDGNEAVFSACAPVSFTAVFFVHHYHYNYNIATWDI